MENNIIEKELAITFISEMFGDNINDFKKIVKDLPKFIKSDTYYVAFKDVNDNIRLIIATSNNLSIKTIGEEKINDINLSDYMDILDEL